MKNVVIIPSYCPDNRLIILTEELKRLGIDKICVINDGSGNKYHNIFDRVKHNGCMVIEYGTNMGKGAAIRAGITYVIDNIKNIQGIVTADGDGQHAPQDILKICNMLENNSSNIILGVRNFNEDKVPFRSKFGNKFSSVYFKLTTGVRCPDTQTGLRGIPRQYLSIALVTEGNRYDYEMNFLMSAVKEGIFIDYIPIKTIYEDNNSASHFRPILDSINIYCRY